MEGIRTLEEENESENHQAPVMKSYNCFFLRVLFFAAQSISELCK